MKGPSTPAPVELRPIAAPIRAHLAERADEMIEFVSDLARLESPSTDPASQTAVQEKLSAALRRAGFRARRLGGGRTGGHVFLRPTERERGAPLQVLLGHTDTVWPHGTLESMPVVVDADAGTLHGPGVFDMKAGCAMIVFALRTLHALGLRPSVTPTVLFNSDEEIGSFESERHIRRLAPLADRVILLEPALGSDGLIKTARRGVGQFDVRVKGKSAHSGMDPGAGASAILELSHVIQELHSLSDVDRGISVNVGEIVGGTRANVVAAESSAVVDVRVATREDARWITSRIEGLTPATPGTTLEIRGGISRDPMERTSRNQALWRAVRKCGTMLGMELQQGTSGGASDGNLTSTFTATIDGMGAVGDGAHAHHEFIYTESLVSRTALLALTILLPPDTAEADSDADWG